MQIIVSSFESVAGFGSAKTYTSLALQKISKQFRCLRDVISNQIRATSKNFGEEDCFANGGSKSVGSRLRLVDHQLRQQRALQQLGMIQNNAWRPQSGLPERAVSMLRAWLFEHFLHPAILKQYGAARTTTVSITVACWRTNAPSTTTPSKKTLPRPEQFIAATSNLSKECNIEEIDEDEFSKTKDKKKSGDEPGKGPSLMFKITNKVQYKSVLKGPILEMLERISKAKEDEINFLIGL